MCDKAFPALSNLKRHEFGVHKRGRNLVCEECGKTGFVGPKNLNDHVLVKHSKEKPYQCHVCEKSYFLRGHLTCHIKRNHGKSDIVCDECDKIKEG